MVNLSIDIETYSTVDLVDCGTFKYAADPEFQILLFAFAYDNEPVTVIDLEVDNIPQRVLYDLQNPEVIKCAFNAAFERICLAAWLKIPMPPDQWECTMVKALMLGLPGSLEQVGAVLNLAVQKDKNGKALIRLFTMPDKKGNRVFGDAYPDKWGQFIGYNGRDVDAERAIKRKLSFFKVPLFEKQLWDLDQKINAAGITVHQGLIKNAIDINDWFKSKCLSEAAYITELKNANSVAQLKKWILDQTGFEFDSITKDTIEEIKSTVDDPSVQRVLELRALMSKTSVEKYQAMADSMWEDGRCRGLLQYYGANRTGRWAGRLIQVQNLPKNSMKDLDLARQLVLADEKEILEFAFGDVCTVLSQLVRTAFIPPKGKKFIVSDFAQIEARVIAWLAGERWRMEIFNGHGQIYEASGAAMFKIPIEWVTKDSEYRAKAKISELALGFQGGVGALLRMGALKMGLVEDELDELVGRWRASNPAIVQMWDKVGRSAMQCIAESTAYKAAGCIFSVQNNIFTIKLPSGRLLCYVRPEIKTNSKGWPTIFYQGTNQTTKKWETVETYGGKLVENIVQATARDLLAEKLLQMDKAGYKIVMHVHDEIVLEVDEDVMVDEIDLIMQSPIEWAKDLPLGSDSHEGYYYKK